MATFGSTSTDKTNDLTSNNLLTLCKFTINENGTATKLTAYLQGYTHTPLYQAKGLIYTDSSNYPGSLVCQSAATDIPIGRNWVDFPLSGSLVTGNYWIGIVLNSSAPDFWGADGGSTNQTRDKVDSFASPSNPAPAGMEGLDFVMDIYCTYTVGGGDTTTVINPLYLRSLK